MTAAEKARIAEMRLNGMSCSQIASILGVSKNTVKSYCRRSQLQSRPAAAGCTSEQAKETCAACEHCGKRLNQKPKQKPKRFCSDKCRLAWWYENRGKVNRKAVYYLTCAYCGKEFESYGNSGRKYCCHACYIKDRFGEVGQA